VNSFTLRVYPHTQGQLQKWSWWNMCFQLDYRGKINSGCCSPLNLCCCGQVVMAS